MRINNNMMAINTHRQMFVSNTAQAKSMEKLSSGYRINRAGDDAAGLAISEKMRGQIRGMIQASRNAQDMISLIQVAEGALAESHSILQRMRELSVQAANDTNTDAERFELQSEVKALKNELDRIGNTTEFNTRKLLEGSARGVADEIPGTAVNNNNSSIVIDSIKFGAMQNSIGNDRSWAFDGAFMLLKSKQTVDGNNNDVYNANDFRLVGPDGKMYEFRELTPYTLLDSGYLEPGVIISVTPSYVEFADGDTISNNTHPDPDFADYDFVKGIAIAEELEEDTISKIAAESLLSVGSIIEFTPNNSITLKGYTGLAGNTIEFTTGGAFEWTQNGTTITEKGTRTVNLDDGTIIEVDAVKQTIKIMSGSLMLGADISATDFKYVLREGTYLNAGSTVSDPNGIGEPVGFLVQANYEMKPGEISANVTIGNSIRLTEADVSYFKEGSTLAKGSEVKLREEIPMKINVAGNEIDVLYDKNGVFRVQDVTVAVGKTITLEDGTVLTNRGAGQFEITTGKITLARDLQPDNANKAWNIEAYWIAKDSTLMVGTQVEDGTLLEAGTVFTEPGSYPFPGSITFGADGKYLQFGANPYNSLEARYHETKVGDGLTFTFARYEPAANSLRDSIMGQIGANSGQIMFVSMGDMRARALGVADVDISTKWGAATAIETVNNALKRVSHQRALLGAAQNRLEHTICNLDTSAENQQAAESRIRDVDMAREVMENTKWSILQQASQAMLAQANQVPQNILQLLR